MSGCLKDPRILLTWEVDQYCANAIATETQESLLEEVPGAGKPQGGRGDKSQAQVDPTALPTTAEP